jgi:hypothetical protein
VLTSDKGQSLNTIEISVLNAGNTRISKQLFGPVIDQLSVDKAVNAVSLDLFDLGLHLLAFSALKLGQLSSRIDTDTGSENLDLISVHS